MPLLLYEGPQTTKFHPSTPSGTYFFKASKTPKFAMVYSSTGSFTRLCVEVLRVLSLLFFELEGISKVGALPPHPRFGPGALASAMTNYTLWLWIFGFVPQVQLKHCCSNTMSLLALPN